MSKIKWNRISEVGLPPEFEPKYSKDGHTESAYVLVFDTFYGPSVDRLWNGEWVSDKHVGIEPAVVHKKVAWAEIDAPDWVNQMLFKKVDKNGNLF